MGAVVLHCTSLLFAGVLAGVEVGVHFGVGAPPALLTDLANLQIRQAVGRRLRILVPALFSMTAATGVAVAVSRRAAPYAWVRWGALLCLAVWIGTRVLVTIPVNSAMLDWPAASPPAGWKDRVASAERFHGVGVWASLLAFVGLLAAEFAGGSF